MTPRFPQSGDAAAPVASLPSAAVTSAQTFEAYIDEHGTCVVARGELDAYSARTLESVLRAHPEVRCLDLGEVSFLDSAGLCSLLAMHQRLADAGATLVVCRSSGVVRRVLRLAGVSHLFVSAGEQDPAPT